MEIYSKGFSDNSIDYIAERKLRAIITKEYAIVTVAKDERSHEELREYLSVVESWDNYITIFFSPEMIVPDLQYVLLSEHEQKSTNLLIKDFKISFFDKIIGYAEQSEKLTRAEVTRLIWQKFATVQTATYTGINEEDKQQLLAQVDKVDDDKWINDKFVELILKYAIYLTCWEKAYGNLAVRRYNVNHLGRRETNDDKDNGSMANERTVSNWFKQLLLEEAETTSNNNIPKSIKNIFHKGELEKAAKRIEEEVYLRCKMQIDRNADVYRKFFYRSHDADNRDLVKATLYELILFINSFAYSWYLQFDKEKVLEFFLDESEHIGDIGDVIDNNTTAAVEIVLMNTTKINQNLQDDKSWVDMKLDAVKNAVDTANKLQLYVIPAALVLLKLNDYKDEMNVENMINSLHINEGVAIEVEHKAKDRKMSLNKKDGGNTLGNFHMFASENTDIFYDVQADEEKMKHQIQKKLLVNRSKSHERNYWTQRKKHLSTHKEIVMDSSTDELIKKYLDYLYYQNKAIRDSVRHCIEPIINN